MELLQTEQLLLQMELVIVRQRKVGFVQCNHTCASDRLGTSAAILDLLNLLRYTIWAFMFDERLLRTLEA